ncbi:hypothetical protein ACA910_016263 [Epithemia clementina (nom. ined.)]
MSVTKLPAAAASSPHQAHEGGSNQKESDTVTCEHSDKNHKDVKQEEDAPTAAADTGGREERNRIIQEEPGQGEQSQDQHHGPEPVQSSKSRLHADRGRKEVDCINNTSHQFHTSIPKTQWFLPHSQRERDDDVDAAAVEPAVKDKDDEFDNFSQISFSSTSSSTSTSSSPRYVMDQDIRPEDILCGRDGNLYKQPGNKTFRDLVQKYRFQYNHPNYRKNDKTLLARYIVHVLKKEHKARFLKRIEDTTTANNNSNMGSLYATKRGTSSLGHVWCEISLVEAREKVSHALRNAKPKKGISPHTPRVDLRKDQLKAIPLEKKKHLKKKKTKKKAMTTKNKTVVSASSSSSKIAIAKTLPQIKVKHEEEPELTSKGDESPSQRPRLARLARSQASTTTSLVDTTQEVKPTTKTTEKKGSSPLWLRRLSKKLLPNEPPKVNKTKLEETSALTLARKRKSTTTKRNAKLSKKTKANNQKKKRTEDLELHPTKTSLQNDKTYDLPIGVMQHHSEEQDQHDQEEEVQMPANDPCTKKDNDEASKSTPKKESRKRKSLPRASPPKNKKLRQCSKSNSFPEPNEQKPQQQQNQPQSQVPSNRSLEEDALFLSLAVEQHSILQSLIAENAIRRRRASDVASSSATVTETRHCCSALKEEPPPPPNQFKSTTSSVVNDGDDQHSDDSGNHIARSNPRCADHFGFLSRQMSWFTTLSGYESPFLLDMTSEEDEEDEEELARNNFKVSTNTSERDVYKL